MKESKLLIVVLFFIVLFNFNNNQVNAVSNVKLYDNISIKLKKGESQAINFQAEVDGVLESVNVSDFKWSNSNPKIISFESKDSFTINGLNYGTSVLTGTDPMGNKTSISIHVFDSLVFKDNNLVLDINEEKRLDVVTQPEANLVNFKPSFILSNPEVLEIDSSGKAIGKSIGKSIVVASFLGEVTEIEVEVLDIPDFEYQIDSINLNVDDSTEILFKSSLHNNENIEWTSKNENIVKVNQRGSVFGVSQGSTQIIARVNNLEYPLNVTVSSSIQDIRFKNQNITLKSGDKHTIEYEVIPRLYEDTPIIWESLKPSVAVVNNGVITANEVGTAVIKARINNIEKLINVNVFIPVESIKLTPQELTLNQGERYSLKLNTYPENASEEITPIYSSSDNNIASVDAYNNVTAHNPGEALIFVKHKEFTSSMKVIVKHIENEEGLKRLIGSISNSNVTFDVRGIEDLNDFIFEIPYISTLFIQEKPTITVIIDGIGSVDGLLINRIELDPDYKDKKFFLEFIDSSNTLLSKYSFEKYSPNENYSIFPTLSYIESPFSNLKSNLYHLSLPVNLSESESLEIHLKNKQFNKDLKVYIRQFNDKLKLFRTKEVELSDNNVIKIDTLDAGEYYLNDKNVESPLMIIIFIILGIAFLIMLTILVSKLSNKFKLNDEEKRLNNESINYKQNKKE